MCLGIGMRNLQFRTFLLFYCNYYYLLLNAQFDLYSVGPTDCCVKCYTAYMVDSNANTRFAGHYKICQTSNTKIIHWCTNVPKWMYRNGSVNVCFEVFLTCTEVLTLSVPERVLAAQIRDITGNPGRVEILAGWLEFHGRYRFTWAPVVMFNQALIDGKVKLVDLFKTMELLNNSYAFYMLGRGSAPPQTPSLSVNAFCIVTNSAHETPVYPRSPIGT